MKKLNYHPSRISAKVRKLRIARGLSRDELARKARVNYNTVIKLESGVNKNPTVQTLIGLSNVLGVRIEDFLV